jgi:hypothetical protein
VKYCADNGADRWRVFPSCYVPWFCLPTAHLGSSGGVYGLLWRRLCCVAGGLARVVGWKEYGRGEGEVSE